MMDFKQSDRGFDFTNFTDRYGAECSLQKSSLATEDAIWLGINEVRPRVLARYHPELAALRTDVERLGLPGIL